MAGKIDPPGGTVGSNKTPAEQAAEHSAAVMAGRKDVVPAVVEPIGSQDEVLHHIHFVEAGLTAWGRVSTIGEEYQIYEGSKSWGETVDRFGRSWLELDESAQLRRWGKVYFRTGPWRGKGFDELTPDDFGGQLTADQIRSAAEADRRTRGKSPISN